MEKVILLLVLLAVAGGVAFYLYRKFAVSKPDAPSIPHPADPVTPTVVTPPPAPSSIDDPEGYQKWWNALPPHLKAYYPEPAIAAARDQQVRDFNSRSGPQRMVLSGEIVEVGRGFDVRGNAQVHFTFEGQLEIAVAPKAPQASQITLRLQHQSGNVIAIIEGQGNNPGWHGQVSGPHSLTIVQDVPGAVAWVQLNKL